MSMPNSSIPGTVTALETYSRLLDQIVSLLPQKVPPPCPKVNVTAWKYGEKACRLVLDVLEKSELIVDFRSTPNDRGGADYLVILIDGSFLVLEVKNYRHYKVPLSPYQFMDKVLSRHITSEAAISGVQPNAVIHRVVIGSIPLSNGASTVA